ncbi:hypothetical protein [Microcoleus vaginatus]
MQAGILAIPPEPGTIAHNGNEGEQSLLPLNLGKQALPFSKNSST